MKPTIERWASTGNHELKRIEKIGDIKVRRNEMANAKNRAIARKAGKAMAKDLQALQVLDNPRNVQIDEMFELTLAIRLIQTWNNPKNRKDYILEECDGRDLLDELGDTCNEVADTFGYDLKKRIHDNGIWRSDIDVYPEEYKSYEDYLDNWLSYAVEVSIDFIAKKYIPELKEDYRLDFVGGFLGYSDEPKETSVYSKTFVVQR
jgi:hypothetical protein